MFWRVSLLLDKGAFNDVIAGGSLIWRRLKPQFVQRRCDIVQHALAATQHHAIVCWVQIQLAVAHQLGDATFAVEGFPSHRGEVSQLG